MATITMSSRLSEDDAARIRFAALAVGHALVVAYDPAMTSPSLSLCLPSTAPAAFPASQSILARGLSPSCTSFPHSSTQGPARPPGWHHHPSARARCNHGSSTGWRNGALSGSHNGHYAGSTRVASLTANRRPRDRETLRRVGVILTELLPLHGP